MTKRTELYVQAYTAADTAAAMAEALAALTEATKDMNNVAAEVVSATSFVSNAPSLGGGADKAVTALKGAG